MRRSDLSQRQLSSAPPEADAEPGRDLRLTRVRRQVLDAFAAGEEPIDFKEVRHRVDPQLPMSLHATVYRSLNYLIEHRLLVEFTSERRRLFALPTRDVVTIVSGGASVVIEGQPIASAIIASALEAGLPVGGRRIVIHIDAE